MIITFLLGENVECEYRYQSPNYVSSSFISEPKVKNPDYLTFKIDFDKEKPQRM